MRPLRPLSGEDSNLKLSGAAAMDSAGGRSVNTGTAGVLLGTRHPCDIAIQEHIRRLGDFQASGFQVIIGSGLGADRFQLCFHHSGHNKRNQQTNYQRNNCQQEKREGTTWYIIHIIGISLTGLTAEVVTIISKQEKNTSPEH